jgi:hypothetical protein
VKNKIRVSLLVEMSDDEMAAWAKRYGITTPEEIAYDVRALAYVAVRDLPAMAGIIVRLDED